MAENQWRQIYEAIGLAATIEQLAEEAAELAAAASKLARIVREENPARLTFEEAYLAMVEELVDVDNARDVLDAGLGGPVETVAERDTLHYQKMTRWYNSLFGEEAGQ